MKYIALVLVALLLFVGCSYVAPTEEEIAASSPLSDSALGLGIVDVTFEEIIRESIDKPSGDLTSSDLDKVTEILGSSRGVVSIAGIEKCTNIVAVELPFNSISDLSPLQGMTIDSNQSVDINLSYNEITDISPLYYLNLDKGRLRLSLDGNYITDLSPLTPLLGVLEWLEVSDNKITSISCLSGAPNLRRVGLGSNLVTDVSYLSDLPSIVSIDLSYNSIEDITGLGSLTTLIYLCLQGNNLSNPCPLSELYNLQILDLRYNGIKDIDCLSSLDQRGIMY